MKKKEIAQKSIDIMQELEKQLGETIGLGCLAEDPLSGEVLAEAEGSSGFAFHINVGYRFPLHTSAPGKILLAYQQSDQRAEFLKRMELKRFTPSTITNTGDLIAELNHVRSNGYSIDVSEQMEGCHCVGVPVFDEVKSVVAALWTTGPAAQLPVRCFPAVAEKLRASAQDISLRLSQSSRDPDRRYINYVIQQARAIMDETPQSAIDMKELAERLYVSYSWFRKAFKEETGSSPSTYHLNLRIEKAKQRLQESDNSIRQIAEAFGFRNQNHFSALFKRKTGLSPSAFRAAAMLTRH